MHINITQNGWFGGGGLIRAFHALKQTHIKIENIKSWLDEHPQFVQDYFIRKANRQTVNSWLLFHSAPQGMVLETSWFTNSNSGTVSPVRKTSAQELESGTSLSRSSSDVTWYAKIVEKESNLF
ncbi:hypothetical protein CEXT_456321 [Caerostris extrusa]|uniref:Uncharacterized protein n=1 Tax=Caerostris extrusa TaxID=172846 RepID=A0AAV4P2L9_CAEEX|nr:hypothetical protein CEXT_456321 [Caerostris extrusa]